MVVRLGGTRQMRTYDVRDDDQVAKPPTWGQCTGVLPGNVWGGCMGSYTGGGQGSQRGQASCEWGVAENTYVDVHAFTRVHTFPHITALTDNRKGPTHLQTSGPRQRSAPVE